MLFLYIFGSRVEDQFGHFKFLIFYFAVGVIANFSQAYMLPHSALPLIGASGAIAGVLGAYFFYFPHSRIVTLIPIVFFITIREIPAFFFLGFWFLIQIFSTGGGIAWWAHAFGFIAGTSYWRSIWQENGVFVANEYAIVPRETMSKTVVIANQKGGVAKTTTAVNLAAFLGSFGKSVLLIDLDPQANATSGIGLNRDDIQKGIYEVLIEKETLESTVLPSPSQGVSVCPAQLSLVGAEVELVYGVRREKPTKGLQQALNKNDYKNRYDFIIIDTPPSLGLLTLNAFTAADSVLIPMQCEYYALEGLAQLYKTVQLVKQKLNPSLSIEGLAVFHGGSAREPDGPGHGRKCAKKLLKDKVYESTIPRNVRLAEAPSFGKSILDYDKTSKGAEAYERLGRKEFLIRAQRAQIRKRHVSAEPTVRPNDTFRRNRQPKKSQRRSLHEICIRQRIKRVNIR